MAFFEVRDEYSNSRFGMKYNDLSDEARKEVKNAIPIIISLAEPEAVK
jgi:predicted nucleic acid-binding OB-fold protein